MDGHLWVWTNLFTMTSKERKNDLIICNFFNDFIARKIKKTNRENN